VLSWCGKTWFSIFLTLFRSTSRIGYYWIEEERNTQQLTRMMKLSLLTLLGVTLPAVSAFAPQTRMTGQSLSLSLSTTSLHATVQDAPLVREAPGSGWEPEWEGRQGLPKEKFLESDMSKPDRSGMWECPLTRWDFEG
jgi:hypothetical protein